MKAAIITAPSTFEVKEVHAPAEVQHWVLLKVQACGICGSDLAIYPKDPPIPIYWPGHEIAGQIDNQLYVVNPLIACNECLYCLEGKINLCNQVKMISHHLPGGFAEYVYVPESNLKPISASPEHATLVEPLASSLHALAQTPISKDDAVVIVGGGLIGLLILQLLQLQGVKNISLIAKHEFQRNLAHRWNSQEITSSPDVIILAVGDDGSALQFAVDTIKSQGTIVIMGNIYQSRTLNLKWLVEHEVIVRGSQRYLDREFKQAIEIIETGLLDLQPLITHVFSLQEITRAFSVAKNKTDHQSIKVIIKPNGK